MDFRRTEFWQGIQEIFLNQLPVESTAYDADRGSRFCSYDRFMDRLDTAARRAARNREFAVLILLQFAPAQNRLGENTGGETGEWPVYRVHCCIRASDSLCCLGGRRFAMLLEDVREPSALPMILEKLNSTLTGPFRTDNVVVPRPKPNLGISLFPASAMSVSQVWRDTEIALEQAVADGPGCHRISPAGSGKSVMEQCDLSRDLYKAYRNDEFEFVYQPVVGLGDRRIVAFEGLLRWQHPVRGCLYPDTFLPLLEDSGLIVPLGEKLLGVACETGCRLIDQGHASLRISINVSFRQLSDRGFMLSVLDAMYESGLPPRALQLEFSESVLTRDASLVQRILPTLNNAGVELAVDQFGTGATSLAELVRLPINLIKLDRSLVTRLPEDGVAQTIISGAGALARATGKAIAAVGVEQRLQSRLLEKLVCREAQGYYYFPPLPRNALGDLPSG